MSLAYFDNLTGIRSVAAVVVLLSHVCQLHFLRFTGLNTPLHHVSSITSEYAVVVFFILSGYLITHTLETNIERNGTLRLDVYIAARIARLYPPFLYAIGVSLTVFFIMHIFSLPGRNGPLSLPGDLYAVRDIVHLSLRDITYALFMLQGLLEINGLLWSLYMEAKLYMLFACALAFISGGRSTLQKLGLAVVFFTIATAAIRFNPGFARYASYWLIGALAYYAWNQPMSNHNRILFCVVLILAAQALHVVKDGAALWLVTRDVLIAILISWLLFRLRVRVPGPQRLVDCSYSLYATHFPVILLAQSLLISSGSVSMGAAIAVAIVGIVSAVAVALVGSSIEGKKSAVQSLIMVLVTRMRKILMRYDAA